jgi:S-layer protein
MGTVTALADTIVGTAGASDTVYITDAGASGIAFAATVTGVENLVIDTTTSSSQTFSMANVSSGTNVKLTDAVGGAGFAVVLSNINGQTIEAVTQEKASAALTNDTDDVDFSGVVITAGKATAATGVSLKVSGAAQEATATSSFAGIFKTTGVATVNNATSDGTYALNLNLDFDGVSASSMLTGLVLTGGGAASSTTNASVTVATDNSYVDLSSLDATGYTGNVIASSMAFNSTNSAAAVTLASVQNITLAAGELARDQLTITGGSGANTVIAAAVTGDLRMASTLVETYSIALQETDVDSTLAATSIDFRDTTGVTNLALLIGADGTGTQRADIDETLTISNLASGATVSFGGADTNGTDYGITTGDVTTINAPVSLASSLNIDNTGAAGAVTIQDLELGSTYTNLSIDALIASTAFTIDSLEAAGLTTLNLENNTTTSAGTLTVSALVTTALTTLTIDSTKGAVTATALGTMNSLETLTVNTGVAASGGTATITAGTSTSLDTITASGTGAFTITALTASSLDSIAASGVTGVVTLGNTTTAALTTASGASIVTGTGNDIVSVNSSTLGTVTLGSVTNSSGVLTDNDTLYLIGAQGSGTGVIDLSQTGDQILTINGLSNTAAQTGIDSVSVAAMTSSNSYGWTLTARSAGSTITGSGYNDVINGGAGADVLNGLAGNDTIATNGGGDNVTGGAGADTITLGSGADTVTIATNTHSQNGNLTSGTTALSTADWVYGVGSGDIIDVSAFLELGTAVAAATSVASATVLVDSGSSAVDVLKIISGSLNETTGVFTTGAASSSNNDYLVQVLDGLAEDGSTNSTDVVVSLVLVNITGTVTYGATTAGVVTIGVA